MIENATNSMLSYNPAKSETVIQKPSVQLEEFEEESLDHHHSDVLFHCFLKKKHF